MRKKNQPTLPPLPKGLKLAKRAAWLMDNAIAIPGTKFRFGLDPILSLHPLADPIVNGVFLIWFWVLVIHYNLPRQVLGQMALNFGLDMLIGLVPVLGDLADAAFKATAKNAQLLEEAYYQTKARQWPFEATQGQGPVIEVEAEEVSPTAASYQKP